MDEAKSKAVSIGAHRTPFGIIVLVSVISTIILNVIIYLYTHRSTNRLLIDENNCFQMGKKSACYIDGDWNSGNLFTALTSFYGNLIVVLVSILALVGTLAVMSIRYSAKQHVESELPNQTERFFNSEAGKRSTEQSIKAQFVELKEITDRLAEEQTKVKEILFAMLNRKYEEDVEAEDEDTGAVVERINATDVDDEGE